MSSPSKGQLSTTEGFICGGIAASIAVTISNPAEVIKTRLQLQGELAKGGGPKVYKHAGDAFAKTLRNEGIRGLQRGLGPAYMYQILLNGSRLGFYEPFRRNINKLVGWAPEDQVPLTSVIAGASSGAVGASLGNPLFLIKARMQAYSPALPVGAQHYYKSSFDALSTIFQAERWRGYNFTKTQLVSHGILPANSTWTFLASSAVSGACVCVVMQPADTALTRMYNQPTIVNEAGKHVGALYKNPFDCLWKTFKTEGVRGWYKGIIVTLTANDLIVNLYKKVRDGDDD
ncbi:hypothetical protein D9758_002199 [Tetrapyrgos nigripes]|uniref:Mitochondrial carrier n=1 Tax=Tetrapyrgos nigripes TaxID=182062 RepID=A0A8H5GNS7_9AGAR|nr:hypothetical protein D9758_002199 [Tetrapyrgos nigripes]